MIFYTHRHFAFCEVRYYLRMVEKQKQEKPDIEKPFYHQSIEVLSRLKGVAGLSDHDRRRVKGEAIALDAALRELGHDEADVERIVEARLLQPHIPIEPVMQTAEPSLAYGQKKAAPFWKKYQELHRVIARGGILPKKEPDLFSTQKHFFDRVKEALDQKVKDGVINRDERVMYEEAARAVWSDRNKGWFRKLFSDKHASRTSDLSIWLRKQNTPWEKQKASTETAREELKWTKERREAEEALQKERAAEKTARRGEAKRLLSRGAPKSAPEADAEFDFQKMKTEDLLKLTDQQLQRLSGKKLDEYLAEIDKREQAEKKGS